MNPNDGVLSLVGPAGPESIDNDGGAVSTVNDLRGDRLVPRRVRRPHPEGVSPVGQAAARALYGLVHGPYAGVP